MNETEMIQMIFEQGSVMGFAVLVWFELRTFRKLVESKVEEAISLLNRIDERTK